MDLAQTFPAVCAKPRNSIRPAAQKSRTGATGFAAIGEVRSGFSTVVGREPGRVSAGLRLVPCTATGRESDQTPRSLESPIFRTTRPENLKSRNQSLAQPSRLP